MKKVLYSALVILVTGCASNSGVVPIGPDTFMVSRQAATGFSGSGTLKAEAFQEANQYCLSQKKKLQVVHTAEAQPPYVLVISLRQRCSSCASTPTTLNLSAQN